MISKQAIMSKSTEMKAENAKLNEMYMKMDQYFRNEWELPSGMQNKQWIYKSVDTSPHNALNTANKVLSAETPRISVMPSGPLPEDKDIANKIERGLGWALMQADRRARSRIVPDIVGSCLRYDRGCVQVVHLPHHYDSINASIEESDLDDDMKISLLSDLDNRRAMALRLGNYAVIVRNPQNVFSRHGEMGLESIVLVQEMTARSIFDTWGNRAEFVVGSDQEADWESKNWTLCDYMDSTVRMVWAVPGSSNTLVNESGVILYGKHKLPFINWVDEFGGTSLDAEREYQCKPFLESIYRSKSWEATNVVRTLSVSEIVKLAGAPRGVTKTADGAGVAVTYGGNQANVDLQTGQDYQPLPPPTIDRSLLEWFDRYKNELNAQTSVQVLADLNFPAGTAYATINAVLQTAIASLQPYKLLAERTLERIFELMLLWVDFTGVPIRSYGTDKAHMGVHYDITKADFSPSQLHLTVELNASAPTDRTERINAAVMLYRNLPVDAESVLSDIGYSDPQKVMRDRSYEDMINVEQELALLERRQETELMMQMKAMPIQVQMQAMAQQMMQPQPQPGMMQQGGPEMGAMMADPSGIGGVPPGPEGAEPAFFDSIEGMGLNGGQAQNQLAPNATREFLSGYDKRGEAIAEAR